MKTGLLFLLLILSLPAFHQGKYAVASGQKEKLKFVILCYRLSPPYDDEVAALNHLADEYKTYVSPVVIRDEDLTKYRELFTRNEFKSLEDYILNKTAYQKLSTSFPVILILDRTGQVKHAWSGDRSDGLKREEFYTKIKAGLQAIAKEE